MSIALNPNVVAADFMVIHDIQATQAGTSYDADLLALVNAVRSHLQTAERFTPMPALRKALENFEPWLEHAR